jgi:Lectin C-type domain
MTTRASLAVYAAAALAVCLTPGCPQMLDDNFALSEPVASGGSIGGTVSEAGSGSAAGNTGTGSGCDVGAGGRCEGNAGGGASGTDDGGVPDGSVTSRCGAAEERGPNGDCYLAVTSEGTWSDARDDCRDRGTGWDLATIRDADEDAFVLTITGYEAWIGATDTSNEGTWSWVGDDAPFFDVDGAVPDDPYTNWSSNEPNDADGSDCLRMLTTGMWADLACDSAKGHVCQQKLQ